MRNIKTHTTRTTHKMAPHVQLQSEDHLLLAQCFSGEQTFDKKDLTKAFGPDRADRLARDLAWYESQNIPIHGRHIEKRGNRWRLR